MGRGTAGLQALAESMKLDDRIGRRPVQAFKLATAAYVHLMRNDKAAATAAMGASLALRPSPEVLRGGPTGGGYLGWLPDAIAAARGQLDPVAVDAATADAATKDVARLTEELDPGAGTGRRALVVVPWDVVDIR